MSLSEDKIKECKVVFEMFDKDKDGKVALKELGDVIRVCGGAPSQSELDGIVKGLESTGNQLVDFDKFLLILKKKLDTQDSNEDLIKEFKKLDLKGDGTMTVNDLRKLMSNYEGALSENDVKDIIEEANPDEDGYINIEKFVKVLLGN